MSDIYYFIIYTCSIQYYHGVTLCLSSCQGIPGILLDTGREVPDANGATLTTHTRQNAVAKQRDGMQPPEPPPARSPEQRPKHSQVRPETTRGPVNQPGPHADDAEPPAGARDRPSRKRPSTSICRTDYSTNMIVRYGPLWT